MSSNIKIVLCVSEFVCNIFQVPGGSDLDVVVESLIGLEIRKGHVI